jgi:tetratricopeptide (TPR) repeat protein
MPRSTVGLLLSLAFGVPALRPVHAADEPGVVALPPFMVEEMAKGPPWRYARSPDFEILSRCDDSTTRQLTETYHRLHRLLALVLPEPLQVKHAVPKTIIYYDEEMRPAASQEIIAQLLRGADSRPPPPDGGPDLGGRGFRGAAPAPRRYSFLPNMRLWDKDAMAIFAIVRNGELDADNMFLTPDYVAYLAKSRTPVLPAWFIAGLMGLYPKIKFHGETLTMPPAEWISDAETLVLKADPKKARPLLPLAAFLRGDSSANAQTMAENLRVWAAQAELFIRWGLEGKGSPRRDGFLKFVERSSVELATEKLAQDCLGFDYAGLAEQLTAFLPVAVRKDVTLRPGAPIKLPPLPLRHATDGEIARIKGDWERLEIDYVRRRYPELAPKYAEQARRTLLRAYDRNDRDPRLLAILGLCEIDAGNPVAARDYLEAAARLDVVRPRAWLELARLRLAEHLAASADGGRLDAGQAAGVLAPLFTARSQLPPLPEVYELIADVWAHSAVPPTPGHLAVLSEGVSLFPRRPSLVHRAAALFLEHGHVAEAAAFIDLGLRIAPDDPERARFTELQSLLLAAPPAK